MKRILQHLFVLAAFICLGGAVFAQDGKKGWQVELKKIAFYFTSTEVKNAKEYN